MPNATWSPIRRISLNSGDVIFIATDGFQEAGVPQCPMFGSDRVKSLLVEHRNASALEILEQLNAAVRNHTSNAPQQDDRTAIVIRVL
jgi:serine phosphatase RsbU (regulator of sigma subunit)